MELTAYSGLTKNWTTQQTAQQINGYQVGDEIAIGYSVGATNYWGYSAFDDAYYELVPEGTFVNPSSMAGGKTAIVIRSNKIYAFTPGDVTEVNENPTVIVNTFELYQNYPNPFNPSTKISWQSPASGWQTLKVFDVLGRDVATLVDEYKTAGNYEIEFNAIELSTGIYFYQLKAGSFAQTRKMILLK
ncbi:MAG: T9SS type A sorting domain-containing protein [Ignavibacteriales bacterium]|nr:T9SS type A sorting domain-containing protein [Ignavibacteriales bacterium]